MKLHEYDFNINHPLTYIEKFISNFVFLAIIIAVCLSIDSPNPEQEYT